MRSWTGRAFRKQGDRLGTIERLGDCDRLVLRAFDVAAFYVNRRILVGEPMQQSMAEIVLGHERAVCRPGEDQDVEPARVIGDEQGMCAQRLAFDSHPGSADPRGGSEKPA